MPKYTSIKPTADVGPQFDKQSFAALIHVKSSRFVERTYEDSNLQSKVAIKWEMGTTKGNTFDRTWTTGVLWENGQNVSKDGKKMTQPIKAGSDANYLLQKIVIAEYPQDKLVDDISVFEGETFFMAEDSNPKSRGSYKGLYPKRYHPEGWEIALKAAQERRAAREAEANAPTYSASVGESATLTSTYTPPTVIQTNNDVLRTAAEALTAIVRGSSTGEVTRDKLPTLLTAYVTQTQKNWPDDFRKNVTVALWDIEQLKTVVSITNGALQIQGEAISFSK